MADQQSDTKAKNEPKYTTFELKLNLFRNLASCVPYMATQFQIDPITLTLYVTL